MKRFSVFLIIEGTYPWYRGGVSEWISRYLEYFDYADFHIFQVATDPFKDLALDRALYDVPGNVRSFTRISPPRIERGWQSSLDRWWQRVLRANPVTPDNIDCIHVANTGFAGYAGVRLAKTWDRPLVLTEHALYWKEVDHGAVALECGYRIPDEQARDSVTGAFREIAGTVYRAADLTISVSECNLESQQELGAGNPRYVPNGVPESWLRDEKSLKDPLTVGWIGRCAEMKNPLAFMDLAEAFTRYSDSPVSFLMMSCDANEPELREEVERRSGDIAGLETVWNRPAREHIDRMDALAITSHNESQPLVLFEALSRKVMPFGWSVGDVNSKYALAFDPGTPVDGIAKSILDCWSERERWKTELDSRFERVRSDHTWERVFTRYRDLFYDQILLD